MVIATAQHKATALERLTEIDTGSCANFITPLPWDSWWHEEPAQGPTRLPIILHIAKVL